MKKFLFLILMLVFISYSKCGNVIHRVDVSQHLSSNSKQTHELLNLLGKKTNNNTIEVVSSFPNIEAIERHTHAYINAIPNGWNSTLDLEELEEAVHISERPYRYLKYLGFTSLGLLGGYYLGSRK